MKSRWRAGVFATIAILVALVGIVLHFQAHSGGVEPAAVDPLQLGVYEANPSVPISVHVEVYLNGQRHLTATVFVRAPQHTKLIVTSSLPDINRSGSNFHRLPTGQGGVGEFAYFSDQGGELAPPPSDPRGFAIGDFALPHDDLVQHGGSVAVRMPTIAVNEDGTQYLPGLAAVEDFESFPTSLYAGIEGKSASVVADPKATDYKSHFNATARFTELFWQPKALTSSETVLSLDDLSDSRLDVVSPFNGTATPGSFAWSGSFGLNGVLVATDRSVADRLANFDFLSGIALATAAAALVAFVQEGADASPRWMQRLARRVRPEGGGAPVIPVGEGVGQDRGDDASGAPDSAEVRPEPGAVVKPPRRRTASAVARRRRQQRGRR